MQRVLLQRGHWNGFDGRRIPPHMERSAPLHVSSVPLTTQGHSQNHSGQFQLHTDRPSLAQADVVLPSSPHSEPDPLPSTTCPISSILQPGQDTSPRSPHPQPLSMENTQQVTESQPASNFPTAIQQILSASIKPSTRRSYLKKWTSFSTFATSNDFQPEQCSIQNILLFLHHLYSKGLRYSSIRVYLAAISAHRGEIQNRTIFSTPIVKKFLRGLKNLAPPIKAIYPTWSLSVVLNALTTKPFEPLATSSLHLLTWKVAFLVAIASGRRASELCALHIDPPLTVFHTDKVVLRPDLTFLPKVVSEFHINQPITLPAFFPSPTTALEKRLHCLDVRRALAFYKERTQPFRTSKRLFICYGGKQKGNAVSSQRLAGWIARTIHLAYQLSRLEPPKGVRPHSTRSMATSTAFARGIPLLDICKAATWSRPLTFVKHYNVDTHFRSDSSFGRAVLSAVLQ